MVQTISIKQIMDNILVNPLMADLPFERAINYAVELIRLVGMPKIYTEKSAILKIENYRALLPCDFIEMVQVKEKCSGNALRYTTNSFHLAEHKGRSVDLTYKLQNSVIFTSFKHGEIEIVYRAIEIDSEGYPLIIDDPSFTKALECYIKKQWYIILFEMGRISPQAYQNVCQEYSWYVGQAQSSLVMPSIDEMESITNMFNTLVPRMSEHKHGFVNNGSKEYIKAH